MNCILPVMVRSPSLQWTRLGLRCLLAIQRWHLACANKGDSIRNIWWFNFSRYLKSYTRQLIINLRIRVCIRKVSDHTCGPAWPEFVWVEISRRCWGSVFCFNVCNFASGMMSQSTGRCQTVVYMIKIVIL